jgi:Phosphate acetyl/butaryl transferase
VRRDLAPRRRRGRRHQTRSGRARGKDANVARQFDLDIAHYEIVDAPHSDAAASCGVQLIHEGKGELLMKGGLHTDELMREVTSAKTGLRTARRISHLFIMDVPTHADTLFITDAAINIFPDLDASATSFRTPSICTRKSAWAHRASASFRRSKR